jgi:uncharacterized protein
MSGETKKLSLVERVKNAVVHDGWVNILTGLGMKSKDKRLSSFVRWERMTREEQEHLYAADEIARKIIDIVPDEAMEKGYKITGLEDDQEIAMAARLENLRFDELFNQAWKNDRMHGGAALFMVCQDGKMDTPMPLKPLLALNMMTKWELFVWTSNVDGDVTSPTFGEPKAYQLQLTEGQKTYSEPVDASRLVRFPGTYLPRQLRKENNYWGDSELNRLKNAIRNYSQSHDSIAAAILDFSVPVVKIKNLSGLIASNGDETVMKRLDIINMSRSIARMILLDADQEDFDHKARQVTGLPELMDKVEGRLVSSTGMPKTKLFGTSPKGMGGEGDHEETNWYDHLKSQQENYLKPRMLRVIRHIIQTEEAFGGIDASTVDIEFNPLWQMTDVEQATVRKTQAETDQIYIMQAVVDPTEVAKSRFGSGKYSTDTEIDMDMRKWGNAKGGKKAKLPKKPVETKVRLPSKDPKSGKAGIDPNTVDPATMETTRPGGAGAKKK